MYFFTYQQELYINPLINRYNHAKYWKLRIIIVNSINKIFLLLKIYFLWRIKRINPRFCCSFGTNQNSGSSYHTPPLANGPYGIIVGHNWDICKNYTIYHQVTLAGGGEIGDNCLFGAGSKVLGRVQLGNYVNVGMNAVVIEPPAIQPAYSNVQE